MDTISKDTIQAATPAEIDSQLAVIEGELDCHYRHYNRLVRKSGDVEDQIRDTWREIDLLRDKALPLNLEFRRRGGWTRAFEVISSDGHIHSSMRCTTTYPRTQWAWLPEVSGMDEAQIIELAAESACTVCYPTAPVHTLRRPARIGRSVAQRAEREAKAAAREAKAAATAAKAITNPDGTQLYVDSNVGAVTTETAATRLYVDAVLDAEDWDDEFHRTHFPADHCDKLIDRYRKDAETLLAALAAKHQTTPGEMATLLEPKVTAKRKRNAAEARKATQHRR